jgi:hypothetical protein
MNYYLCYKKEKEKRIATNEFSLSPSVLICFMYGKIIYDDSRKGSIWSFPIYVNISKW